MNKGRTYIRETYKAECRYVLTDGFSCPSLSALYGRAVIHGYTGSKSLLYFRYSNGIDDPARLFQPPDPTRAARGAKAAATRQSKSKAELEAALVALGPRRRY